MGFAGQVFAARVAVGLAMPSPKAFSQAGAMIGGFASKMYNSLNKKSLEAAQRNVKVSKANLDKAKANLQAHSKTQDAALTAAAAGAVTRLNKSYEGLTSSAVKSASAIKGLKGSITSTKVKGKLFANVDEDLKDGENYATMMENFTKLAKHERKVVMESFQARKLALDTVIAEANVKTEAGKKSHKIATAELTLLKLQEKEFNYYNTVRNNADEEYTFDKKAHLKEVQVALDQLAEHQEDLNEVEKEGIDVQRQMTEGVSKFVIEMKTGFIEALRESISLLSAFYYKLNQNTQELIEFERELMNANSVFQVTRDELFDTGDTVVQFGQRFGLEMQNGATGLYQLASAGLSASDSLKVLTETLKLSMAVQGDHNTISKLVTQTLFGFDMEMDKAAEIADKFAFAIQKSLIEYQDLASAVKFALPFFTTTGQSIDQLLGALQILTNRALEAGIAGRGLRQGLAELAESIGDNTARFRDFGIEVTDAQGNMLKLTEIAANFSDVLHAGIINDTELLTTLIEDLNVRGATAFVHLVQASDEFTQAVEDTKNAGGQLDEMVRIQNESIGAQIQILKNNVAMMFLYRDATFEGTLYLNAFHKSMVEAVASLREMLVVEKNGVMILTAFGLAIQTLAITGVQEMEKVLAKALPLLNKFIELGALGVELFKVYLIPVKVLLKLLETLGPNFIKWVLTFHLINKLLPITIILQTAYWMTTAKAAKATVASTMATTANEVATRGFMGAVMILTIFKKLLNFQTEKGILLSIWETIQRKIGIFWRWISIKAITANAIARGNEVTVLVASSMNLALNNAQLAIEVIMYPFSTIRIWANTIARQFTLTAIIANITVLGVWLLSMAREWLAYMRSTVAILWKITAAIEERIVTILSAAANNFHAATTAKDSLVSLFWLGVAGAKIVAWVVLGVVTWIAAGASMAFLAAILVLIGPIILVGLAIGIFIGLLYVAAKRINEQIDVMWVFMQVLTGLKNFFFALGYELVRPFIWLGNIIYELIEVHLFKFILFMKHLFAMLSYYVFAFIAIFTGDDVGSTMKDVLMAPFNAMKGAIMWVVGVLYTNEDSLLNKMKGLFNWIVTTFKVKEIFEAIVAVVVSLINVYKTLWNYLDNKFKLTEKFHIALDAAKSLWNWIKSKMTWDSIKGMFAKIGKGIVNLWLAPLKAVEFIWNKLINTLSGKGFTVWNPVPGDNDFKVKLPNLDKWKLKLSEAIAAKIGMAEGGYIQAMAKGGVLSKLPALVGEKGPELFMPSTSGRIIPTKDLSSRRVRDMLRSAFKDGKPGIGVDKIIRVQEMTVGTLKSDKTRMNKTRMGVDTFA